MHKLNPNHIRLKPEQRLYQCPVPIIAITGSIATGKSTVTNILKERGYPVIDADVLIKKIYTKDEVLRFLKDSCPEVLINKKIDFKVLREAFFRSEDLKVNLEKLLYRFLEDEFNNALGPHLASGSTYVFYDVPLLFEKNIQNRVDQSVTVYCPKEIQLKRLISRDDVSNEFAKQLIANQIDIEQKKSMSHLVIYNTGDLKDLRLEVEKFLQILEKK